MAIVKLSRADRTTALEQPSEDIVDLSTEEIRIDETGEYIDIEKGPRKAFGSSLLANLPSTILPVLGVFLVLSILAAGWLLFYIGNEADKTAKYVGQSSQLLMLSQRLAKDAREAALGNVFAFVNLQSGRDVFEKALTGLNDSDSVVMINYPTSSRIRRKPVASSALPL